MLVDMDAYTNTKNMFNFTSSTEEDNKIQTYLLSLIPVSPLVPIIAEYANEEELEELEINWTKENNFRFWTF